MDKRILLDTNLEKIFKKFTLKEIFKSIVPILPNVSLNGIKKNLEKCRLKATKENIGKVVKVMLQKEKLEVVQHIYNRICLLNISLHVSSTWVPYSLLDPVTKVRIKTVEQMERMVLQALRIERMNGDIYATISEDLFYVMIVFKKLTRKTGLKLTAPIYFSVCKDDPYLFLMNKKYPDSTLTILSKALGFESSKKHSRLTGKDIKSLLRMLKNKTSGLPPPEDIPFEVIQPEIGHRSKLMLENEARLRHINHHLGEDPIMLDELKLSCPTDFKGNYEGYINKPFKTSLTIKSEDSFGFIKFMAWKGIIKPPYPTYIKKLNVLGKNQLRILAEK